MIIDVIATVWGIQSYQNRVLYGRMTTVNIPGLRDFEKKAFSNEKMVKTFPNLRYTNNNGEIAFVRDLLN